jgi:D-sedoheptulose 7-phosphate isomerase
MIVFTNGCFDLLHAGHVDLLERARSLGDRLIVGINSDASIRAIKGNGRPVQTAEARQAILLALRSVDEVRVFDEPTPESLIKSIRPDVLVKGGDWSRDEIIGADFVESYGGKVLSLPLKGDYSSSAIIEQMRAGQSSPDAMNAATDKASGPVAAISLREHMDVVRSLAGEMAAIERCAELIVETFAAGRKVLLCGNGGSAADAQHIAAEFTGRYEAERRALPAIALTTDTSALTALANDYDFERIFARQVDALAHEGDCLIAISTSGTSPNVIAAVMAARKLGCLIIGMTGAKGKKLAGLCDACLIVPSERTARIQEAHITVAHIWCETVDRWIETTKK